MTSNDSINRDALIRLVNLVKPALSTQDYIPALKHILFADGFASTYNDNLAIQVAVPDDLNLGLCLPGDMLGRALGSFNAETVLVQPNEKDGSLVLASGRGKIKVKTLPAKDFPLEMPKGKAKVLELTDEILGAIRRCLISVGNNPSQPASMGVTLDVIDGKATLYSTDNATISQCKTKSKISLPGDAPVILPTFFCEQLVALAKAYPKAEVDLQLHMGAVIAEFIQGDGEVQARLFSKTLADLVPFDFPRVIAKHCEINKAWSGLAEIPASFDAAFDRALLVLGAEVDKATKITAGDDSLRLVSLSDAGEASDSVPFPFGSVVGVAPPDAPFFVDPVLIARASKACSHVGFFNRVVVFGDAGGSFLHLVAHCSH